MRIQIMRRVFTVSFCAALLAGGLAGRVEAQDAALDGTDPHAGHDHAAGDHSGHDSSQGHNHPFRDFVYSDEILELAGSLPVQDGGRVKPLSTVADFKLLKTNGKRELRVGVDSPEGKLGPKAWWKRLMGRGGEPTEGKLSSTAWMLDALLFPGHADHYEVFRIDNSDLLTAIGADSKESRRGWYSYEDIAPSRRALGEMAQAAFRKEQKDRNLLDNQSMALWSNLVDYERLTDTLSFTRVQLPLRSAPAVAEIYPEERPGLSAALERFPALREAFGEMGPDAAPEDRDALVGLVNALDGQMTRARGGMGLFAPSVSKKQQAEWMDVGQVIERTFQQADEVEGLVPVLAEFEAVEQAKLDPVALTTALGKLHVSLKSRAEARGEYAKIPMERSFYAVDFFYKALLLFGMAFLFCTISWMLPRTGWVGKAIWIPALVAEGLLIGGIVMRCILRSRPPVSTLYETILFIAGTGVLVALVTEWITRKRMALNVAVIMGMLGMFIAGRYELREAASAGDTMPSLVAVLDTNFWLATHVTSITLGYAAGLLASAMGHAWLVMWALGKKRSNPKLMREVKNMMYGVLCFALLFSVVGTILGGVWANDSWGRFWGWDPKENGALLICLSQLAILHARLGGLLKDLGLVLATIFGGMIVAFSWWHVNLLGVGLHSYGFTDGVLGYLTLFYVLEVCVIAIALVSSMIGQLRDKPAMG